MPLDSRLGASPSAGGAAGRQVANVRGAEQIESGDRTEFTFRFGPARGIFNAVFIGAGAWMIILAAVALTRAIFFG